MVDSVMGTPAVEDLLDKASGLDNAGGDARLKTILRELLASLFATVERHDVTPNEFWSAVSYITRLGQANEAGLLVAGLGIEHFLDIVMDEKEKVAGLEGGTPRTIEGPLWLADAPLAKGEARLDQDPDEGEVILMDGQVKDADGQPVPGAIVDVWHANSKGGYSFFDPAQSKWNLRRRIEADGDGRYKFRSTMPAGYGCPPDGPTQELLNHVGRHGQRPAHIHFFVEAPGFRKLTTQINIAGDKYLHEDFAFATRDELIVEAKRGTDPAAAGAQGFDGPFSTLHFDFALNREAGNLPDAVVVRAHAQAG